MAGLRCGEVSSIALPVLAKTVDACVAVDDASVIVAMEQFGSAVGEDPAIDAGASGACGLAALRTWLEETRFAPGSRAFVINTEGTTDPAHYAR
jgi:diaminopropionate ammonia-lyase